MTLPAAIAIISGVVLAHEIGHFLAAKLAGVKVEELGIGYPPRLLTLGRWGGTRYTLNIIPFGGFVRIPSKSKHTLGDLAAQSKKTRLLVLLAGPGTNFLLAVLLFSLTFWVGIPMAEGFAGAKVIEVLAGTPAARAGLEVGDIILKVDDETLESIEALNTYITEHLGEEMLLLVRRGEEQITLPITPQPLALAGQGPMGVVIQAVPAGMKLHRLPGWRSLAKGLSLAFQSLVIVACIPLLALRRVLPPETVRVTGPIGVVSILRQAIDYVGTVGWFPLLQLTALINVSLVVGNLLPIPALDGGHLLLLILETIRGRRLTPECERRIHLAGLALLIVIMIAVTYSDLTSAPINVPEL